METRKTTKPYPSELRERAVRLVREQAAEHGPQWSAIRSIAEKVGCTAETLRLWVRRSERDRRFGDAHSTTDLVRGLEGGRSPFSWMTTPLTRAQVSLRVS